MLRRLRSKYRVLMIDERTYEERFSLRLSRMNVLLVAAGAFVSTALLVGAVIVLTPLKRYIPGYSDQDLKRYAFRSTVKADSLADVVHVRDQYIDNLRRVLRGELPPDSASLFRPIESKPVANDLAPGAADSALRQRIQQEEAYALAGELAERDDRRRQLAGVFFFPPLRGIVTNNFDREQGHYGIDVVSKADEAVKACLDGTVITATWTTDGGHILQVQHHNDLVSVYKHCSVLLKRVGDRVKAGEAVAIVGDSGELTTGPHLHFELWLNGEAIDPQVYMVFQ